MPLTRYNSVFSSRIHSASGSPTNGQPAEILFSKVNVKSLLLLLNSTDDSVLLQTLVHLNRLQNAEDLELLNNVEITRRLLDIVESSGHNECLRKLALKLMTTLVKTESGTHVFCNQPCTMQVFVDILNSIVDSITLELTLYIVSILTIHEDHCRYLACHHEALSFLNGQINDSPDIDIQFNSVKILENMMICGIVKSPDKIPVRKIFHMFLESNIKRLQASCLHILYLLTELEDTYKANTKEMLTLLGGFNSAFELVDSWGYDDQNLILLCLIETLPLQYFDITALKKILSLVNKYEDVPAFICPCINILAKLCSSDCCQDYVIKMDIPHLLVKYFLHEDMHVAHAACEGIRILCDKYPEYLEEISTNITILQNMFQALTNNEVDAECKARLCKLLLILMQNNKCCDFIIATQEENESHESKVSNDTRTSGIKEPMINILIDVALGARLDRLTTAAMDCIYKLSSKQDFIRFKQLDKIIHYFHGHHFPNNKKTETFLEILARCLASPTFLKWFVRELGIPIIDDFMRNQSDPNLLLAYGNLLINACKYPDLAVIINDLNTFQWLNQHDLLEVPLWNHTISTLLNINLSLKFAFCNSLNFIDITSEGFYVFQYLKHVNLFQFPSLDNITHEKHGVGPVFVFTLDEKKPYKDDYMGKYISDLTVLLRHANNVPFEKDSEHSILSAVGESNTMGDQLRQNLKEDVEIIATYVVNQMIGHGDDIEPNLVDSHLEEIIKEQESNVIPLGHVKIGLQFERCVLFKVLCDRFGYPCTLVRDEFSQVCHNHVRVEFTEDIGDFNFEPVDKKQKRKVLHYLVDLMVNPAILKPFE